MREPASRAFPGGQDLPFQRNNFGGRLGGRVIEVKLFFFLDGEHAKQDLFTPVIGTDFTPITSGSSSPYRDTEASGRLDWQALSSTRVFYKFGYNNNSVLAPVSQNFSPILNRNNTPSHTLGFDSTTGTFNHSLRFAYSKFVNTVADVSSFPGIFNPAPGVSIGFLDNALTTGASFWLREKRSKAISR